MELNIRKIIIILFTFIICEPLFANNQVKIIKIIDGDTFDVQFKDGTIGRVRLVGIDTPESLKENDQEEYEGINDPEYLKQWAFKVKNYSTQRLLNKTVFLRYDNIAGRRGYYGRLLAYVLIDNTNFNLELVEKGFARTYIEANCELLEKLKTTQNIAMKNRVGLWSGIIDQIQLPGACPIIVIEAHYNAAGNDNINLNDEYIIFQNSSNFTIDLSSWIISDAGGNHEYVIPKGFILEPGIRFTVFTGSGINTENSLFWGKSGTAVWNNNGDKVYLSSPTGEIYEL